MVTIRTAAAILLGALLVTSVAVRGIGELVRVSSGLER